jgi:hypothetical protein
VSRSGPAGDFTITKDRRVWPRRWPWIHVDAPFDSPHDRVELTMINSVYEDHASVERSAAAHSRRIAGKVADVVRDEDPFFG